MDPEHARVSTGVDEFWDDDDNTSVDFTPRRAHLPDTIELVGAPGPPSGLDTNWWDASQDALWDAAESDPPAHAPLRALNAADTGAWSLVLEPRPPWYRSRPAAIALLAAAAAGGLTIVVLGSAAPPQTSRTRPASRLAAPAWPVSSQLPARPLHHRAL